MGRATGKGLHVALLEPGAAQPLHESLRAFLGREPNADALLSWHGLVPLGQVCSDPDRSDRAARAVACPIASARLARADDAAVGSALAGRSRTSRRCR